MSPEKSLPQALHHSLGRTEYPPQRNYKKLFTFFLQRQETSLWFRRHTSQALPGTRPTRLSPPIGSLYVPRLLTCFITRILTLSASHLVASQDMPPFVVPGPPQPRCTLFLGTPMQIFPTQIPYDATQGVVQDTYPLLGHVQDPSHALPWNAISPFDNSVKNRTLHSLPTPLH